MGRLRLLAGVVAVAAIGGALGAYFGLRANLSGAARGGAIPSARTEAAMAFDDSTGTMVLFGGLGQAGTALRDTWTWHGHAWTEQHPATSPPSRFGALMAYDPQSRDILLFGGSSSANAPVAGSGGCASGGSASGTGATATTAIPAPTCLPSSPHAAPSSPFMTDTWTWDGADWRRVTTGGPYPPWGGQMAADPVSGHVVLVTAPIPEPLTPLPGVPGAASPLGAPCAVRSGVMPNDGMPCPGVIWPQQTAQTWVWRDGGWHLTTSTRFSPGPSELVTDPRSGRLAYFTTPAVVACVVPLPANGVGGTTDPTAPGSVSACPGPVRPMVVGGAAWTEREWTGSSWTAPLAVASAPLLLAPGVAASDPATHDVVLVTAVAQTWTFNGTWKEATPRAHPAAVRGAAMAYEPATKQVVLFGGATGGGVSSETWAWDGSNWSLLTGTVVLSPSPLPATAPPAPSGGATSVPPAHPVSPVPAG